MIHIEQTFQQIYDTYLSDHDLKQILKEQHDFIARRMNRLTLLGLLGALNFTLPKRSGIYLSSSFGSPSTMQALLMQALSDHSSHPFGFINSIHNAPTFHIAQTLNTSGPNIFLSSDSQTQTWVQPLFLALLDYLSGKIDAALIGWVHEHKPNQPHFIAEGVHFLKLSKNKSNCRLSLQQADADFYRADQNIMPSDQYYYAQIQQFLAQLDQSVPFSLTLPAFINGYQIQIEKTA